VPLSIVRPLFHHSCPLPFILPSVLVFRADLRSIFRSSALSAVLACLLSYLPRLSGYRLGGYRLSGFRLAFIPSFLASFPLSCLPSFWPFARPSFTPKVLCCLPPVLLMQCRRACL
jgi:hypothetical protein